MTKNVSWCSAIVFYNKVNNKNNLKLSILDYLNIDTTNLNLHFYQINRRHLSLTVDFTLTPNVMVSMFPQRFDKFEPLCSIAKKSSAVVHVHVLLYDELWTPILVYRFFLNPKSAFKTYVIIFKESYVKVLMLNTGYLVHERILNILLFFIFSLLSLGINRQRYSTRLY